MIHLSLFVNKLTNSRVNISDLLKERVLVLDGAMGTMIQRYTLSEDDFRGDRFTDSNVELKGNNDILSLTRPDIIQEIHEEYLEAGADIIETNTFSGTSIAQADYELQDIVYELNFESARIAKEACIKYTDQNPEKPRFVAGAIGPTNKTASLSPDVNRPEYRAITFDQLAEAYKDQARGLMDGGVDALLIETIFDTLNAKAALYGISELFDEIGKEVPLMISGTITDKSGRTLSGQTVEAFLISLSHMPLLSIGLNCSFGARDLKPYLQNIASKSPFFISAYPNAGLPNAFGEYDQDADTMGEEVRAYLDENLINIIGGCCGTGPAHIKRMTEIVKDYKPRFIAMEHIS